MKNVIANISRMGLLLGLTAIATVCVALPVRAALPYPTASTVSQLGADINYANTTGGTFTINLAPGTTFSPVQFGVGYTNAVNLTIIGNGSTLDGNQVRLIIVDPGSSLTLERMTLQNGYIDANNGGAIYNEGTLTISGCTFSNNTAWYSGYDSSHLGGKGGAIYNGSGTVVLSNSILSGNVATGNSAAGAFTLGGAICNDSGTLTISGCTFSGNSAGGAANPDGLIVGEGGAIYNGSGKVTVNNTIVSSNYANGNAGLGGGVYNAGGTTTVENSSRITDNTANGLDEDVDNYGVLYLDDTSTIGILDDTPAIIVQVSKPSPRIFPTRSNTVVVSWPYPSTGWSLQQNSDLTTTNWVAPTNTVANDGTNNFIIANPSSGRMFFRLKF
jgi:hypothetical protein